MYHNFIAVESTLLMIKPCLITNFTTTVDMAWRWFLRKLGQKENQQAAIYA